ncbi:MAG TPA: hypothetical protein VMM78_02170 [Thermomicrobiales bacterium]|nr:hypothetical protein [Thermomicrobiales bacterium]
MDHLQKGANAMSIDEVLRRHQSELMAKPNVQIVAQGEKGGRPVIIVYVTHKVPLAELQPDEIVPKRLGGYDVDVEESGSITAQLTTSEDEEKHDEPRRPGSDDIVSRRDVDSS